MPLPKYVRRVAESTEPQPYQVTGGQFICFALAADKQKLQQVVDRYFNDPSGGDVEYKALSEYVIAANLHIADSRSTSPEDAALGAFYVESDLLFFVPVAFGKTVDGKFKSERVVWFAPAVFVDTSAAVAEGREVYGFPKLLARCVAPRVAEDPAHFSVTTGVYQGTPIARQLRPGVIFDAIRHDAGTFGEHDKKWGSGIEAMIGMLDLLEISSGSGFWEDLREKAELFTTDQRLLVLKQFRDAADGTRACLIQIVECPITVTSFKGAGIVEGDWTVTMPRYAGLDLAAELGIKGGNDPIKPLAIYWVKLDCRMENGIITWSSLPTNS